MQTDSLPPKSANSSDAPATPASKKQRAGSLLVMGTWAQQDAEADDDDPPTPASPVRRASATPARTPSASSLSRLSSPSKGPPTAPSKAGPGGAKPRGGTK